VSGPDGGHARSAASCSNWTPPAYSITSSAKASIDISPFDPAQFTQAVVKTLVLHHLMVDDNTLEQVRIDRKLWGSVGVSFLRAPV
jgi:hypothetical protein